MFVILSLTFLLKCTNWFFIFIYWNVCLGSFKLYTKYSKSETSNQFMNWEFCLIYGVVILNLK
jgi:hypothetical protein